MAFSKDIFTLFDRDWALVTAGDPGNFNTMTVSWGALGTLWSKPCATVYVRPSRHTHDFMEKNEYFTVSFFGGAHMEDLSILGTLSGRDGDKLAKTGLHAVPAGKSTSFAEAKVTLVCRKLYAQEMDAAAMSEDALGNFYADGDVHTMYIGEVVEIIDNP